MEHGRTVAALKERIGRLTIEVNAVVVVLAETYQALGAALLADQPKLLARAVDKFNAVSPENRQARCEQAVAVAWCAGLEHDGEPPAVNPLGECERHAEALTSVPVSYVAAAIEPVAHLLATDDTTAV